MDFHSLEGFEEFFADGVINPAVASPEYREKSKVYRELTSRVFALHEPAQPEFDLVFLHGIGSNEFHCWSTPNGLLWPAEFIPQDFPTARVLTVGYEHSLWNWKKLEKKESPKLIAPSSSSATPGQDGFSKAWESFSDTVESSLSSWWTKGDEDGSAAKKDATLPATTRTGTAAIAPTATVETVASEDPESSSLLEVLMSATSSSTTEALLSPVDASAQGSESLQRVAADVASRILSPEVGVGVRPVIFVVHSMGGLVAKRMLVSLYQVIANAPPPLPDRLPEPIASIVAGSGEGLRKVATPEAYEGCLSDASALLSTVRGVVFYCTPHFGSGLASVITGMQRYYQSIGGLTPTHVVTGLGDHNKDELKRLNTQFVDLIERLQECRGGDDLLTKYRSTEEQAQLDLTANPPGFSLLSFGETQKLKSLVRVVEPESANPVPDDPRFPFYLVAGDHGSVNRPETKTSPAYSLFYGFLDRMQQRGRLQLDSIEGSPIAALQELTATASGKLLGTGTEAVTAEGVATLASLDDLWTQCFSVDSTTVITATTASPVALAAGDRAIASSSLLWDRDNSRNEATLSARVLHSESETLRVVLSRFFGRASPPELDGVLHLSADILTQFRRLQDALVHAPAVTVATASVSGTVSQAAVRDAVLESFTTPILLAVHWTRWTTQMIQRFELEQRERHLTVLESTSGWEAVSRESGGGTVPHLYTAEVDEINMIQNQISMLQGEWEGFRRYTTLHVSGLLVRRDMPSPRNTTATATANTEDQSYYFELLSNQALTSLFFSKALRSAVSCQLHDGGFISNLLCHYMDSVVALGLSPLSLNTPVTLKGVRDLDALRRLVHERDYALSLLLESMTSTSSSLLKLATADDLQSSATARRLRTLALTPEQLTAVAAPLLATSSFLVGCIASTFRSELWRTIHGADATQCLGQALNTLTACQHAFDKQYRFAREGAVRLRAAGEKESQDSWWLNKTGGKNRPQLQENIDELDAAFKAYAVLAATMELGTHVLLVLESLNRIEDARVTCFPTTSADTPSSPTLTAALEVIADEVVAGQRSYENLERVTRRDAAAAEMSKPFAKDAKEASPSGKGSGTAAAPASGAPVAATAPADAKQPNETDILETAKATFKAAMAKLLKETDDADSKGKADKVASGASARGPAVASTGKKGEGPAGKKLAPADSPANAPPTPAADGSLKSFLPWPPKAASKNAIIALLNSAVDAWEAVRRGEDKPLTPAHFAHSMMVAWWAVEERAAVVGKELGATRLTDELRQRRKSPKTPAVVLESLAAAAAGVVREESEATAVSLVAVLAGHADATLQVLQNVDHTISSEWLALRGASIEKTTLHASTGEQKRRLEASLHAPVSTESTALTLPAHPAAAVLRVPFVSPFVMRAVQLDNGNSLAQCLQGNRSFVRLRTSPDAAHAYQTVLRRERVPSSALYRHAAVGLAWIHLHRVTSATMEIASTLSTADLNNTSPLWNSQRAQAAVLAAHRARGPCQTGVVDSLSALAAPVHFLSFYKRGWEAASMGERQSVEYGRHLLGQLYEGGEAATPAQMAAGRAITQEVLGRSQAEVAAAHRAMQSALEEHIHLSQHYFNEVLQADPTNVGALCGAGRLCTLVLPRVEGSAYRVAVPSPLARPTSSSCATGDVGSLLSIRDHASSPQEAMQYFRAALAGSTPTPQVDSHTCEPFSEVNNIFRSYAANWLGDYGRPETTDFLALSPAFGGHQHVAHASATQKSFDASCAEAAEWYGRAVNYSGLNDWALCNLGVLHLQTHHAHSAADVARGVNLLEKALELNPTNQWALWGISRHSPNPARQDACRATLRRLMTMTFRSTFL